MNIHRKVTSKEMTIIVAAVMAIVVAVAAFNIWPHIRNDSLYVLDKDQTKAQLETFLENISIPASRVYSNVSDAGCDSVKLRFHCDLVAEKYYKSHGDIKNNLSLLNQQLEKAGWEKVDDGPTAKGKLEGSASYISSGKYERLILHVELFVESDKHKENYFKKLIQSGKIAAPQDGESIYGIRLEKTYWTCTTNSLFELPCPALQNEAK